MRYKINHAYDNLIIDSCKNSLTMSEACSKTGLHFNTFRRHAVRLGVYKPNPGGKGSKKPWAGGKVRFPLDEVLLGKHPQYQTLKLKKRLLKEGIKQNRCETCGISDWNGKPLNMELDHINGNRTDHLLENLRMICPNCHSQTDTYRGSNVSSRKVCDAKINDGRFGFLPNDMKIPDSRKVKTVGNARWLLRNLGIHNENHSEFGSTIGKLREFLILRG